MTFHSTPAASDSEFPETEEAFVPVETEGCEMSTPRWATFKEAASYLRLKSDVLIREAVKNDGLKAYPIGNGREARVDLNEVDEWMKSRSYEPRSA
ncbi:hypothetical protein SEA_DAWORST_51 [Mycobacterium phage DaWorst]|nr:hypothetical protein SEA_DAWORST_51 [Mycobacterium phage DaWorst]